MGKQTAQAKEVLRVFLARHNVAMVANCFRKMITTCSPMTGQVFDAILEASVDKYNEWL